MQPFWSILEVRAEVRVSRPEHRPERVVIVRQFVEKSLPACLEIVGEDAVILEKQRGFLLFLREPQHVAEVLGVGPERGRSAPPVGHRAGFRRLGFPHFGPIQAGWEAGEEIAQAVCAGFEVQDEGVHAL